MTDAGVEPFLVVVTPFPDSLQPKTMAELEKRPTEVDAMHSTLAAASIIKKDKAGNEVSSGEAGHDDVVLEDGCDGASSGTERVVSDKDSAAGSEDGDGDGDEDATVMGESWDHQSSEQVPGTGLRKRPQHSAPTATPTATTKTKTPPSPPPTPLPLNETTRATALPLLERPDPDIRWKQPVSPTRGLERDKPKLRERILSHPFVASVLWLGLQLLLLGTTFGYWAAAWARILALFFSTLAVWIQDRLRVMIGMNSRLQISGITGKRAILFSRTPRHLSVVHSPTSLADVVSLTRDLVDVALDFGGAVEYLSIYEPGTIAEDGMERLVELLASQRQSKKATDGKAHPSVDLLITTTSDNPRALPRELKVTIPIAHRHKATPLRNLRIHFINERSSGKRLTAQRLGKLGAGASLLWRQNPGGKWVRDPATQQSDAPLLDPGLVFSPNVTFPDPDLIIIFPAPPKSLYELLWKTSGTGPMLLMSYPAWWLRIAEIAQLRNEDCTAGLLLKPLLGDKASSVESTWAGSRAGWVNKNAIWKALRVFAGREKREGK